jgi:hypothetical protein
VTSGLQECIAQDFKKALETLKQKYERLEKFHLVMSIRAFDDSVTTRPYYEEHADIKKDGTNYCYHFGEHEMLLNSKYLIVVDKTSRDIVCSPRDVKAELDFFQKNPVQLNMDSILNQHSEGFYLGSQDGIDHYKVMMKSGPIKRMDLFIAHNENVLSAIQYSYGEGQRVEIGFQKFNTQPVFANDTFNENIYMTSTHGRLQPSDSFKRYKLLEVKNQ